MAEGTSQGSLKAQLEVSADSSGVAPGLAPGKKSVAEFGAAGAAAGKQVTAGMKEAVAGTKDASTKIDASTRSMIGAIQRQISMTEAGGKATSDYYRILASQRGVDANQLKPYLDQLDAVNARQKQTGISAGQMTAALRGVPAQFTDIVTSIQGGQNPLTVFLQQGGQLKDMFGGAGPAAKALGGYILGLINPLTIAAGAAGALAIAYHQGSQEGEGFRRTLILTGNAVGLNSDQLADMAERIGRVTGSQGAAAEALQQFVASGAAGGDQIERFTTLAIKMEKATGQSVGETIKQFEELGKSPVEASNKLNERTNYLTGAILDQIKALDDQGRASDAAALAQATYATAMEQRTAQVRDNLGIIEKAWKAVKAESISAWDAMVGIGREQTLQQQLADIAEQIETYNPFRVFGPNINELKTQQANLQEMARLTGKQAQLQGEAAEKQKAMSQWIAEGNKYLSKQEQLRTALARIQNEGEAANVPQDQIDVRKRQATEKLTDKSVVRNGVQLDKARLGADIDAIKQANDQIVGSYANAERILDGLRSAGQISESEYYEAKRAFIRANEEVQTSALQKEIARYQQEKLSGKEGVDNARKIAEAQSKMATLRADASAKTEILNNQEIASLNKLAASYLAARQAAQSFYDTQVRQQQRSIDGLGKGAQQRGRDAGLNQIEDRYAQQRLDLDNQRALLEAQQDKDGNSLFTDDERKKYDQRLATINEFQTKSVESYNDYYDTLIQKQGDWALGAQEGLQNYLDQSNNTFSSISNLTTRAFEDMGSALADFAFDGKANFKDLTESILRDLLRIQMQKAVAGFVGSLFGDGFSAGAGSGLGGAAADSGALFSSSGAAVAGRRAAGGPVSAGSLYEVNERGPELLNVGNRQYLMMGAQNGSVTPNSAIASGANGGVSIVQHINVDSRSDQATIVQAMLKAKEMAVGEVQRAIRSGSQVYTRG